MRCEGYSSVQSTIAHVSAQSRPRIFWCANTEAPWRDKMQAISGGHSCVFTTENEVSELCKQAWSLKHLKLEGKMS